MDVQDETKIATLYEAYNSYGCGVEMLRLKSNCNPSDRLQTGMSEFCTTMLWFLANQVYQLM